MPRISVIMSVKDSERYLEEAVSSILCQTFGDFEFLILDDGSRDGTWDSLARISENDQRVRVFRNTTSTGLADALNSLIERASGEYIARMDGDDISSPTRFESQVKVLESGAADLCGSWICAFGDQKKSIVRFPVEDAKIRIALFFSNPISHPSVMVKRATIGDERYGADGEYPEDYGLWQRLSLRGRMHNLPKPLLWYRRHSSQTATKYSIEQIEGSCRLAVRYLDMVHIPASGEEKVLHGHVRHPAPPRDWEEVVRTEQWLLKLCDRYFSNPSAREVIAEQYYRYCLKAASRGPRAYRLFRRSRLRDMGEFQPWQERAILMLGLLRIRYGSRFYRFLAAHSPRARLS